MSRVERYRLPVVTGFGVSASRMHVRACVCESNAETPVTPVTGNTLVRS